MKSRLQLLGAMGIFGTIGIFVRYIPLSSATIAFVRGILGVLFLLLTMLVTRQKPAWTAIRRNLVLLLLSGAAIGLNWVLLFESYRYTSVAVGTVCYYLAPLFLILMSPLLKERLDLKKILCVITAFVGMALLSGIADGTLQACDHLSGILLAGGAAVLYASVMLMNKKLTFIPAYDKTVVQLFAASVVILPYLLLTKGLSLQALNTIQWALLVIVGIVHTGIAYAMYFGSMKNLPAHTIAIFSYLDPVLAVILSTLILQESLSFWGAVGAILILGSALYSELPKRK